MKIAITGASGFIGTELLQELNNEKDLEVIALSRTLNEKTNSQHVTWKITDYSCADLEETLGDVDAVIHLAGVRGTTSNREDYIINEAICENLLKAILKSNVGRIVFASTISVYNDVNSIPWTEESKLEPRTMYGESKIACEELIKKYLKNNQTYSILRIAQVIGMGEKRKGMMNTFLEAAAKKSELTVIGKSEAKRQYIYVKDLVKIIKIVALQKNTSSQILNVGMPNAYTNLEIAKIINEVYKNNTPINYDDKHEETIKASCMSIEALKNSIHFEPLDMKEAISAFASHQSSV